MTQTIEEKAAAILAEGRLRVERVDGAVVAACRSSDGQTLYRLGFDPRNRQWRCTCPVPGRRRCSHLAALRLVVDEPSPEGGSE